MLDFYTYPALVIKVPLQIVTQNLKLGLGFGETGIGTIQFLNLVLEIEIFLGKTCLGSVSFVQLACEVINGDFQTVV